jgi:predicted metal-dependent hydrolase
VRVSQRCRRLGLRFSDDGLEVVAPPRLRDVSHDFLFDRFSGWIRRQLLKRERRRERDGSASGRLLLRGQDTRIEVSEGTLFPEFCRVSATGGVIRVDTAPGRLDLAADHLRRFLFEEARRDIGARLAKRSGEMEQPHGVVQIREQKSLWGSCSPRSGKLSFNAKLVMAPPAVLDYIVVHELAHFRWSRHGVRFWDRVARYCPDYKPLRRWLRDNAWRLSIPSTADELAPFLAPAPR